MLNKATLNEYSLYESGMSITQINAITGIPLSTLRFRFKAKGILRSTGDAIRLAAKQGRIGSGNRGKKRVFSAAWRENVRLSALARGERNAKGKTIKPSGYVELTRGKNKGRSEHIVILEEHIGRRIMKGESTHHINGNKQDNRIENLQLLPVSEHIRLHSYQRDVERYPNGRIKTYRRKVC